MLAARDNDGWRDAFSTLCRRYWTPIYASLRRRGFAADDAEDLVQGFFLHLVEHDTVARADPQRGRFRSFLLGALRWFLSNDREREAARKRGGENSFVAFDIADAESAIVADAASQVSLDLLFDRNWARTLVRHALAALQAEYVANGQAQTYAELQSCLDPGGQTPPYSVLAERLGSSENAVKVAVHRLRGRFRDVLRSEVESTVETAEEIEGELAHLRDVLAAEPAAGVAP